VVRIEQLKVNEIYQGDALSVLKQFPSESVDCVVTSPPYWALRDYGVEGQLGLEPTAAEYVDKLGDIFDEVRRVLKPTGTCWVNLGDTYMNNSSYSERGQQGFGNDKVGMIYKRSKEVPQKSLCQIPSRFAIEMCNRGWILRNEIIWYKPNCMPASVKDRFTVDFEKLFFFVKQENYRFEQQYDPLVSTHGSGNGFKRPERLVYGGRGNDAHWQPSKHPAGRNKRCVWTSTRSRFRKRTSPCTQRRSLKRQ
jgi:DNA modification methylase